MANPRKFSEKIALLNQKQAEETAAFEAIMREVSDVTSRVAGVASASNSVVASPTGCGAPGEVTPSVKSAGASPPLQSSGKHLRINLGNQFKAGGSLPNVNNNRNNNRNRGVEASNNKNGNEHGNGNNIPNSNNDDADNKKNDDDENDHDDVDDDEDHHHPQNPTDSTGKGTADIFPAGLYSVDLIKPTLNNAEESQANSTMYQSMDRSMNRSMDRNMDQSMERGRSMVGPMRSRPAEKRHDTSPYSGVPYLLSPPPDTWRRTNSDSALHQSVNDSCQMPSSMPHRRGSDAYPHMGGMGSEHRESHRGFMERPRSSCEMPRVPGINIYPSSQPPGQQIPIGNNTGSLPDLSNVHFPPPLQAPLDQEDHSSSTPYSTGVALDNSTSTSQQDLHSYTQPPPPAHSPQHFIYQQPHSPVQPQSPKSSQSHQPVNPLGTYRTPQTVSRPSPQSSPSLTVRSPLSYSNNPSAPPSPTGHLGQPNFPTNSIDQNTYLPDQTQATALQQHFEHFTMGVEWAQIAQHLAESGCTWTTQLEMDSPVATTTLATYISSPNHTTNYTQSEMINVSGELGSGDAGYFSTSPQLVYQPRTPTSTQQLTPQTPNTPRIILTDFSANHGLSTPEFVRDDFDPNLFSEDDVLKHGLEPLDFGDLQMLTDSSTVLSDPAAEHHFRLD
ncbi:CREB-regulated transcription coactivator 1-like isoform X9 [Diprion similis]|uniref:CREB-regulated transcription coactivator 1-like isoform X9 n=1 Tax=Diprion similis TaxID=362088 RepID=UPI001EF81EC0|nr:CREB-regulated transcription coactivator 1-like isoform X9 [Diprion similis]